MASRKILLTGATGYIGGSILSQLLASQDPNIKASQISVLIRGDDSRLKPFKAAGVDTFAFRDLDDTETIEKVASEHDIVIGAAFGYHTGSAVAIIKGLSRRKAEGKEAAFIHTDGTSNVADQPISGKFVGRHIFSDVEDDIYKYMLDRQAAQTYIQRATSLAVIETGKQLGVPTYTMMAPTIYGTGSGGKFGSNTISVMIPLMMRDSIKHGKVAQIGDGRGRRDYVHVLDLARLYELLLAKILAGEAVPSGEKGIFFSGTDTYTWKEAAESIAEAGYELGALKTRDIDCISPEEAAARWGIGYLVAGLGVSDSSLADLVELGVASNAITRSEYARSWGWKPARTPDDFQRHFKQDFAHILGERQS